MKVILTDEERDFLGYIIRQGSCVGVSCGKCPIYEVECVEAVIIAKALMEASI